MSMRSIATATTLVVALISQMSLAAIPPMSQEMREEMATDIATGYVVSVKKEIQNVYHGSNAVYTVKMIVNDIQKGLFLVTGYPVTFQYWKANDRPDGWCGDGGQYGNVKRYEIIKAYLVRDESTGSFSLIKPNGFDKIN